MRTPGSSRCFAESSSIENRGEAPEAGGASLGYHEDMNLRRFRQAALRLVPVALVLAILAPALCALPVDAPESVVSASIRPIQASGYRLASSLPMTECENPEEAPCACRPAETLVEQTGDPAKRSAWVCLGSAGVIVAEMSEAFIDGQGPDLRVYEYGALRGGANDTFSIYVSANGSDWVLAAEAVTNDPGHPYASIEIPSDDEYLYVRIVAAGGSISSSGPAIIAVEALHSARRISR